MNYCPAHLFLLIYAYRQDYDGNYNPNVVSFSYNATGDYAVEFERRTPLKDEAPYNQPYEYRDNGTDGYYEAVENPMTGGNYYYISDRKLSCNK